MRVAPKQPKNVFQDWRISSRSSFSPPLSPSLMQTQPSMVMATSHELFSGKTYTVPMCMTGTCLGGPRLVMPEASYELLERAGRKWLALARNIGPHLGNAVLGVSVPGPPLHVGPP